jgi:hypothetical protein
VSVCCCVCGDITVGGCGLCYGAASVHNTQRGMVGYLMNAKLETIWTEEAVV